MFQMGQLAESLRNAKGAKLRTLQYFTNVAGAVRFLIVPSDFGAILGAMKLAGCKSGDAHVKEGHQGHSATPSGQCQSPNVLPGWRGLVRRALEACF